MTEDILSRCTRRKENGQAWDQLCQTADGHALTSNLCVKPAALLLTQVRCATGGSLSQALFVRQLQGAPLPVLVFIRAALGHLGGIHGPRVEGHLEERIQRLLQHTSVCVWCFLKFSFFFYITKKCASRVKEWETKVFPCELWCVDGAICVSQVKMCFHKCSRGHLHVGTFCFASVLFRLQCKSFVCFFRLARSLKETGTWPKITCPLLWTPAADSCERRDISQVLPVVWVCVSV